MASKTKERPEVSDGCLDILTALAHEGPMTQDEFTEPRGLYVQTYAALFNGLRKKGLAEFTGEKRLTVRRCKAGVVRITDAGRAVLEAAGRL